MISRIRISDAALHAKLVSCLSFLCAIKAMRTEKAHVHRLIRYVFIAYVLISLYALVGRDFKRTLFQNADSSLQGRDSIARNNAAPNDNVLGSTTWAKTDQKVAALWINSQGMKPQLFAPSSILCSLDLIFC
jgi:hypothetical protein